MTHVPAQASCSICGFRQRSESTFRDTKSGKPISVSFCQQCGFVQQTDIPTDTELKVYYSHNYRTDYKNTYTPKLKHVHRAGIAACNRLKLLLQIVESPANNTLLDVGAGGGEFVYLANQLGFQASGIEPNQGYSEFARDTYGVSVVTSMVQDLDPGSADIITLFHVLEHIADPIAVMERFWHVLKPGGLLFIEVPNILQPDASPANIYFKAHLHYFSRFTLAATASRYFAVETVEDRGNLKMVLVRRDEILPEIILPTAEDMAYTQDRLAAKGWSEYLTVGGGWKKPLQKLARAVRERTLRGDPRGILDTIYAEYFGEPNQRRS